MTKKVVLVIVRAMQADPGISHKRLRTLARAIQYTPLPL